MRYTRFFALLLPIVLAGCGGGSGGGPAARSTSVTIRIVWPTANKAISRVIPLPPAAVNPVINVEAFVGNQPVGAVQIPRTGGTFNVSTTTMNLPVGAITLFANEYASPASLTVFTTNPLTGHVQAPAMNLQNNPPLAHAVTTVNLTAANPPTSLAPITFTLDNTIVGFKVTGAATYALAGGTQPLSGTIEALDANGDSVMFNPADLSWSIDPTDPTVLDPLDNPPLMSSHASITSGGILTPKAVGTFHVQVSDKNVNGSEGQVPIVSSLTYQILSGQVTVTFDNATLVANTPAYAKSVEFVVTQTPLGGGTAGNSDNAPQPVKSNVQVTFIAPLTNPPTLTIPALVVTFTPTGRAITYTLRAWSELNAQGVKIAETTVAADSNVAPAAAFKPPTAPFKVADYRVKSFVLSPVSPDNKANLYYFTFDPTVPQNTFPVSLPTSLQMQVSFTATADDQVSTVTSAPIDPATVTWTKPVNAPNWLMVSNSGFVNTYDQIAAPATPTAIAAPTPVTITVTDAVGKTGSGVITINNGSPTFGVK